MEFYGDDYRGADVAPFVGINTFLHLPWVKTHEELKQAKPDVAIIGEPFDFGTTIRPGARYGPRALRAASTIPSPPYERFNIETGADPFGTFRTVDYGDVHVSPGRRDRVPQEDDAKGKGGTGAGWDSCHARRRSLHNVRKRPGVCQKVQEDRDDPL